MELYDLEKVSEIESKIFTDPWSCKSFEEMLNGKYNHYFVIEVEKNIVGYFGIQIVFDEGQVHNIGIVKEQRGKGYGNQAFKYLLKYCEGKKVLDLTLEVRKSNIEAIGLYEKYGFNKIRIIKNYYINPVEDGFLMKLDLGEKQWMI